MMTLCALEMFNLLLHGYAAVGVIKADLEDHSNELKMAEDNAKKAMADAAKLAEELRHEQEHSSSIEKLRRTLESQVKELQVGYARS